MNATSTIAVARRTKLVDAELAGSAPILAGLGLASGGRGWLSRLAGGRGSGGKRSLDLQGLEGLIAGGGKKLVKAKIPVIECAGADRGEGNDEQ